MHVTASDASELARRVLGTPEEASTAHPPLLLAHGFTQTHRCWGPLGAQLGAWAPTVAVDLPGHGDTTHDTVSLTEAGDLLAQVSHGTVVIGYSMGGRIALHAAVQDPASMLGLVLIGATAGIVDSQDRGARRERDAQLATDLEQDLPAFIDRWLDLPMFQALDDAVQFRAERLTNRAEGLAGTLRTRGTGSQEPLHDRLGSLDIPVLTLTGDHDDKFRAESEVLIEAIGTNATAAVIADAGHACHLERPAQTAESITSWLAATFA